MTTLETWFYATTIGLLIVGTIAVMALSYFLDLARKKRKELGEKIE
jgi:hypothetical protein